MGNAAGETPENSPGGLLFGDERATKAVLSSLHRTKVGQMVTIPPRDGEGEEEGEERELGAREEVEWEGGGQRLTRNIEKGRAACGGRLQGAK